MQHHLDGVVLSAVLVALAPVIAHSVRKDAAVLVEGRGCDAAAYVGVALETVLGVLVPEVERAVGARSRERSVDRVERDVVDGMYVYCVVNGWVAVAFEREVRAVLDVSKLTQERVMSGRQTWRPCPRHIELHNGPRYCQ